jgi:hypothetical protein
MMTSGLDLSGLIHCAGKKREYHGRCVREDTANANVRVNLLVVGVYDHTQDSKPLTGDEYGGILYTSVKPMVLWFQNK